MKKTENIPLKATWTTAARREIRKRWPKQDVKYEGFDEDGKLVFMSLVRGATKGNVATMRRNNSKRPVRFTCTPVT